MRSLLVARLARSGGIALMVCLAWPAAPAGALETTVQAFFGGQSYVLVERGGRFAVLEGDLDPVALPRDRGETYQALVGLQSGWLAAGVRPPSAGSGRELVLVRRRDAGLESLPVPPTGSAYLRSPSPLVADGELVGLVWIEGGDPRALGVRAAAWTGAGFAAAEWVSPPAGGSQLALSGAILGDGTWLAVWSAFDGTDDEIVWSRREGESWTAPAPLHPGNRVPDITPVVAATARGAVAAWSRYEAGHYRVRRSRFRGGAWRDEERLGAPGSVFPFFVVDEAARGPRLVWETAEPDRPVERKAQRGAAGQVPIVRRGAGGGAVYLAFGDSITEGVGDEAGDGYPALLEEFLIARGEDAMVVNHGLGGETTAEGLTRIDSVLADGGDVLLLMEGTNDIPRNVSIETTVFNLGEMARRAEAAGMEVVLATVIPRVPDANFDRENFVTQQLDEAIRDLAGTSGRGLADPFEELITTADVFDELYDRSNPEDHVGHPNHKGYDRIAQVLFDVLTGVDSMPPVTGLTRPGTGRVEVRPNARVRMEVWDFGTGIDVSATEMLINGDVVDASVAGNSRRLRFEYTPRPRFTGTVEVGLRSRDRASPPNTVDRVVTSFRVGTEGLAGDIDLSGRVDGVDLVLLARSFGATAAEIHYLPEADFNNDEVVDGEDLAVLASHFGEGAS